MGGRCCVIAPEVAGIIWWISARASLQTNHTFIHDCPADFNHTNPSHTHTEHCSTRSYRPHCYHHIINNPISIIQRSLLTYRLFEFQCDDITSEDRRLKISVPSFHYVDFLWKPGTCWDWVFLITPLHCLISTLLYLLTQRTLFYCFGYFA